MKGLRQDLAFALRSLAKSPGFAVVAIVSLGLGIGANTTVFSVADAFVFRPLEFPDPDHLISVWRTNPEEGWDRMSLTHAEVEVFREAPSYEATTAMVHQGFNLSGLERPERVIGSRVEPAFFGMFGVEPIVGRPFTEADGRGVVVVSERLWERSWGEDPALLGSTIKVDGEPHTVVGIAPADFEFPNRRIEVWVPLEPDSSEMAADYRGFSLVGRTGPGRGADDVLAEATRIAGRLAESRREAVGLGAIAQTVKDDLYGTEFELAMTILMLAVLAVLLIACANIANLMLARAAGRTREIAVRSALGAGRRRIARQLLTESVVLALLGGALGLVLAIWGIDLMRSVIPAEAPRVDDVALSGRALGFTAFLCVAAGLLFGLAPAIQASRPDLVGSLKEGGARGATAGRGRSRLRSALVVAEIAMAIVLLVATGLMVKGYRSTMARDAGYEPDGVMTMWVDLPQAKYPEDTDVLGFQAPFLTRLEALPRVEAATLASALPLFPEEGRTFEIVGRPAAASGQKPTVSVRKVSPGYFATFEVPLVEGRLLDDRDRADGRAVMLVSKAFVRRHFPDESPIGRLVRFDDGDREIVGVVGDTRDLGSDEEPRPAAYFPHRQVTSRGMYVALKTPADTTAIVAAVRGEVGRLDPDQPVSSVMTMNGRIADASSGFRIISNMLSVFSLIALVLAAGGVYGVMAYGVSQRTHEFGIRMAIGAEAAAVRRMVLRQGLVVGAIGIAIGLAGAAAVTRFMEALLLGVSPLDPLTFAAVTGVLLASVVMASWVPARRATRVDPMVALRYE